FRGNFPFAAIEFAAGAGALHTSGRRPETHLLSLTFFQKEAIMAASKKSAASIVKRPISRKRIRANRRNAKKSTGPKTAAGKRIVSRNALVHGLRSQHFPLLPYENSAEYREFEEAMERDCYPQGVLQRQVAYQITQISWKLRRIPSIEAALLKYHNLRGHKEFEEGKEDGTFGENDQLAEPSAEELIAMQ